ncbi:MAG: hypothetical protein PHW60_10840 [Kiritimatiellae bacterium]|nr:hypothetical protein [Kiritimatiellia bacterium]
MAEYKADWAEARRRMIDWWGGRPVDRVPAFVTAPRAGVIRRQICSDVPAKYIDCETIFYNLDARLESNFWGAEAFPHHLVYMGPMFCCAYLGCEPMFEAGTTWYKQPYSDWTELRTLQFDRSNRWWRLTQEIVRRSVERAQGRYLVTNGSNILAVFDLFAELIGTESTLMAMLEYPDEMRALRDRVIAWGLETYDILDDLLRPFQDGRINGMQVWTPGRVGSTQCDLCVMISPDLFRDLVVEELRRFYAHVDFGIYHLDGEEQIKHLDALLEIDTLKMIQFVPVTKACEAVPRDPLKWTALYRRIIEAGKKVLIYCPPDRIEKLLRQIPREGVFLCVTGCHDEKTARAVITMLERIGM